MRVLFSWLGEQDLKAFHSKDPKGAPIPAILSTDEYSKVVILTNWAGASSGDPTSRIDEVMGFKDWMQNLTDCKINVIYAPVPNPIDVGSIYTASLKAVEEASQEDTSTLDFAFNLSSGTWAMAIAWSIIAKTQIKAECLASAKDISPSSVTIPFDLRSDFVPEKTQRELANEKDQSLKSVFFSSAPFYKETEFKSGAMKELYTSAILAADHSYPVMITGELGTEKSAVAKLIHDNDMMRSGEFVQVFCSGDHFLDIDRKLFGERGSKKYRKLMEDEEEPCFLDRAKNGTLYLEDIDLLHSISQSQLLEVIQQAELSDRGTPDLKLPRIIASSKSPLFEKVQRGEFSEELFFKLSIFPVTVPSLTERGQDTAAIAQNILEQVNKLRSKDLSYSSKHFSAAALDYLTRKKWYGNLLELETTIKRAALTSHFDVISEKDLFRCTLQPPVTEQQVDNILNKSLGGDFSLKDAMADVAKHYLILAKEQSGGNATLASKLVGLSNYQMFLNWYEKYVEDPTK